MSQAAQDNVQPTYQRGLLKTFWYWLTSTGLWISFKLLHRLQTEHRQRVPMTGPVVVVSNHQSHFDPPLIGGATRRQLSYLARDTLFKGFLGPLIRSYDAVPVDREGTGLAGIRATLKRLKQGGAVLVFPEGTRSPDGELQPLKPGFLALVRRSGAVIVPLGIDGAFRAWPKGRSKPKPFVPIAVHYGEPITAAEVAELSDDELLVRVSDRMSDCVAAARRLNGVATEPEAVN